MPTFILYHANCADGFGAAWAAYRKFGDEAEYLPVRHGAAPPDVPDGASVYLLDFAYSRSVVLEMRRRFRELTILDHHRSAQLELGDLPYAQFSSDRSGAVMAWEHFHPGRPVPELLRYVMDRDLWAYELPRSREVSAALSAYPLDFDVWNDLDVTRLADEGVPILRYVEQQVRLLCDQARLARIADHDVPIVNAPVYGSEVGEELLKRHPDAAFAAIYFDREDGVRQWSLRSRDDFDVSEIARRFQNGGHRQAAGFETKIGADFVPQPPGARRVTRRK